MKKLLFTSVFTLLSFAIYAQNPDEEIIKKACIDQTEAFFKRDLATTIATIADVPYASRYWPNNAYNGSESIRDACTKYIHNFPQPIAITIERSNWQLKSLGENYYWATYDQISTAPDSKKNHSKEARLLEKINGQWKMVSIITLPMQK